MADKGVPQDLYRDGWRLKPCSMSASTCYHASRMLERLAFDKPTQQEPSLYKSTPHERGDASNSRQQPSEMTSTLPSTTLSALWSSRA